ncbi:MAG: phage tail protein I [Paraperlucidibaca sp.]|nr:phage tail protein I [Paraperlucidibaca sp.]MBQ0722323.1 phage tail protein I [Paraperlucidibaca sp.]
MTRLSLLPPNSTALERAFESVTGNEQIPAADTLWNAATCPPEFLPWLAWSIGVETWDTTWTVEQKRRALQTQMQISLHRGTVWSVREALRSIGYGDATFTEGLPPVMHDGSVLRNGLSTRDGGNRWALFKVTLSLGESTTVTAEATARMVDAIRQAKPVRSLLHAIEYESHLSDSFSVDDEALAIAAQLDLSDFGFDGPYRDGRHTRNGSVARRDPSDTLALEATLAFSDAQTITPLRNGFIERNGQCRRDGVGLFAGDRLDITVTKRQRRNGRITRDGTALHRPTLITQLAA